MSNKRKNDSGIFFLDPEYETFIPGTSRLKISTLTRIDLPTLVLSVIITIVLILLPTQSLINEINKDNLYRQQGVPVTLRVTDCIMVNNSTSKNTQIPEISYTYTVNDQQYHGKYRLGENCANFPLEMEISGMYLRDNPASSRIITAAELDQPVTQRHQIELLPVGVLCIVLLPMNAFFLYVHFAARSRRARLTTNGQMIEGRLMRIKSEKRGKTRMHFVRVTCRFKTPDGNWLTHEQSARREDLRSVELPPIGTPVNVLYADSEAYVLL